MDTELNGSVVFAAAMEMEQSSEFTGANDDKN